MLMDLKTLSGIPNSLNMLRVPLSLLPEICSSAEEYGLVEEDNVSVTSWEAAVIYVEYL